MIFERSLLDRLPEDEPAPCIIRDALTPSLLDGAHIHALYHRGLFSDLGTHDRWIDGLRTIQKPPFQDEVLASLPAPIVLKSGGDQVRFVPKYRSEESKITSRASQQIRARSQRS